MKWDDAGSAAGLFFFIELLKICMLLHYSCRPPKGAVWETESSVCGISSFCSIIRANKEAVIHFRGTGLGVQNIWFFNKILK